MDLEEDMVIIGEGKVKLRVSKSGKYLLPLERNVREHANTDAKGRRKIWSILIEYVEQDEGEEQDEDE